MEVTVYQNQVERALKVLKRQLTKDGMLKELKRRRFYEKPSIKKKRKQKEAKERVDKWINPIQEKREKGNYN